MERAYSGRYEIGKEVNKKKNKRKKVNSKGR